MPLPPQQRNSRRVEKAPMEFYLLQRSLVYLKIDVAYECLTCLCSYAADDALRVQCTVCLYIFAVEFFCMSNYSYL